jgi:hypothetical protein
MLTFVIGVAHADLKLAKASAPDYPSAGESDKDHVLEHYSWKKVTTNVSGFIVGNPTIDHYGEMRVSISYPRLTKTPSLTVYAGYQSSDTGPMRTHLQTTRMERCLRDQGPSSKRQWRGSI